MGKFKNKAEYETWKKEQGTKKPLPPVKKIEPVYDGMTLHNFMALMPKWESVAKVIGGLVLLGIILASVPPSLFLVIAVAAIILGPFYLYFRKGNQDKLHWSGDVICPNTNCNYRGKPTATRRGSVGAGLLLCLFFLLPGLIYFIVKSGYRYTCPRCGIQLRSDT